MRSLEASKSRTIESPKAFLASTARNLALNHITSASTRLTESLGDDEAGLVSTYRPAVEDEVETGRHFRLYCQAVKSLPTQCRKVFTLK